MRNLMISFILGGLLAQVGLASKNLPLSKRSAEEILKNYTIIGDFSTKASLRDNGSEIFWRYPLVLPRPSFPIEVNWLDHKDFAQEVPVTKGSGRPVEHLNRGRIFFLKGEFVKARDTWLSARARYGRSHDFHRRTDYFIALSFLYEAYGLLRKNGYNYTDGDVRGLLVNATTFYSWAYGVKKDIPDPLLDRLAPRNYYNQVAIYYTYERWSAAFGSVEDALEFLRRHGRKEYRAVYRRLKGELYIRNRDYLAAAQQYDLAIRQDPKDDNIPLIFARIGDMYFDLNNFELAEDMYSLSIKIGSSRGHLYPWQLVLRGECLFWMGKFDESIKMMSLGLDSLSSLKVNKDLPFKFQALASLRIADAQLAKKDYDKARLSYFKHRNEFRAHESTHVARLRLACLELPYYEGKNIGHSRKELESLKTESSLPIVAQELIWTCEMASYAKHDRDESLVNRAKEFYQRYPNSDFLKELVGPLVTIQSRKIDAYFAVGDDYHAVTFFELNRKTLFMEISDDLKRKLFSSYVKIGKSMNAREFYESFEVESDLDRMVKATMLSEVAHSDDQWAKENKAYGLKLSKHKFTVPQSGSNQMLLDRILIGKGAPAHYTWIYHLSFNWIESNFDVACNLSYPVLKRIGDLGNRYQGGSFATMSKKFIGKYLEDMLKYETFCAYSILEFEQEVFADDVKYLAQQYLSRGYMPVNNVTAGLFFSLAEKNLANGNNKEARSLWQKIVDTGDNNLLEMRYARARLDNRRTQLEKLWK